jgi:hypothetical protein
MQGRGVCDWFVFVAVIIGRHEIMRCVGGEPVRDVARATKLCSRREVIVIAICR